MPIRSVVGKMAKEGIVEFKIRKEIESREVQVNDAVDIATNEINKAMA